MICEHSEFCFFSYFVIFYTFQYIQKHSAILAFFKLCSVHVGVDAGVGVEIPSLIN